MSTDEAIYVQLPNYATRTPRLEVRPSRPAAPNPKPKMKYAHLIEERMAQGLTEAQYRRLGEIQLARERRDARPIIEAKKKETVANMKVAVTIHL